MENEKKIPIMITIKEATIESNLPEHFIRSLCWNNKIKTVRAGRRYLINRNSLIDFLNSGE